MHHREKRKSDKAAARNKKAEDEKREKEEAAAVAAAEEAAAADAAAEARKLRQVEKKAMQKQRSKLRSLSSSLVSSKCLAPVHSNGNTVHDSSLFCHSVAPSAVPT